ncbi:5-formyltetrahydrofolate cyclo-ligase [Allorhizobium sp. BGMRC 0089]|uniref:5-formyltetrahydrofolate cyclo-ligase n=1 Tax=Allorhizobium sonneratiae TaxID=2934936 RepID=UPI0020335FC7|nr:5-formyltetrahydrofolate cyclo-ligase [Allorhizobium sonneratiae]MCM2290902.1 5-formyltetrahydrofolate cyclo-ligase [Allorhizobium sonneratiae]
MCNALTKAELRKTSLDCRDNINPELHILYSQAIARHGAAAIDFAAGTVVSGFYPIRSEVDVMPLMRRLADARARLCLPVVLDRQTICFRLWMPDMALVKTGFGTMGPGPEAEVVDPDILLIPLAAFDGKGNRIGYGAGHYDRAIARLHEKDRNPLLIGIAFDCQEVAEVPFEPHDVALNGIITESGYRRFKA